MSLRNKTKIYKWLSYSLYLIFFTALQLSVFSRFPLFGASPMLAPCIVAFVSMLECGTGAVVFTLCAGIMTDALTGSTGFYTITLTALSVLLILLVERIVVRNKFVMIMLAALSLVVVHVLRVLLYLFFSGASSAGSLWAVTLPMVLYSTVLSVPVLLLLSKVDARFNRNTRQRFRP